MLASPLCSLILNIQINVKTLTFHSISKSIIYLTEMSTNAYLQKLSKNQRVPVPQEVGRNVETYMRSLR
jgi:hypothetical protein